MPVNPPYNSNLRPIQLYLAESIKFYKSSSLKKGDVRKSFFARLIGIIVNLYMQCLLYEYLDTTNKGIFQNVDVSSQHPMIKELLRISCHSNDPKNDEMIGYLKSFQRQLIIDSWSLFESSITYILDSILSEEEKNKLRKSSGEKKILGILKKYEIDELDLHSLLETMRPKSFYRITSPAKYAKLYSLHKKKYMRDWSKDVKFLNVFGDLRNSMHSNFTYFGKENYVYSFGMGKIEFNNSGKVKFSGYEKDTQGFLDLVKELCEIYKALINGISIDFIEDKENEIGLHRNPMP